MVSPLRVPSTLVVCIGLWSVGRGSMASPTSHPTVNTGDPLPRTAVSDRRCLDRKPGSARWLGSNPHVPFFIAVGDDIQPAGSACCAPWAVRGSRWRAIGRYGEVTGVARVRGGEGYDVTQCYELDLAMDSGAPGVGLFVSEKSRWKTPTQSARWEPTQDALDGLERMVGDLEALLEKPRWESQRESKTPKPSAVRERMLSFAIGPVAERGERVEHFVAVGGRALIIARLDGKEGWKLSHVDLSFAMDGAESIFPLAAFDVDGDGVPEFIYHWNAGDNWADAILRFDDHGWTLMAESVGGSTASLCRRAQFPFTTESSGLGGNETMDRWRARGGEAWMRS